MNDEERNRLKRLERITEALDMAEVLNRQVSTLQHKLIDKFFDKKGIDEINLFLDEITAEHCKVAYCYGRFEILVYSFIAEIEKGKNCDDTVNKHLAAADLQQALLLVRRAQANIRGNPKCTAATSLIYTAAEQIDIARFLMTTDDNTEN